MINRIKQELLRWVNFTDNTEDCWLWVGPVDTAGYGRLAIGNRKRVGAHRAACILAHGQPGHDQWALHSCDNPLCCNPWHLSWGDNRQNQIEARDRLGSQGGALTKEQAEEIKGSIGTQREIAEQYGISEPTVWKIRNGRIWLD